VYFGGTPARLHDEILGIKGLIVAIFGVAAVVRSRTRVFHATGKHVRDLPLHAPYLLCD
jgi:CO/xanthine dehydrogenase Mo-binding subunit